MSGNPATDIKKQIEDDSLRRYVLSVVSGQEHIVIENLRERVKKQDLSDDVVDYLVPVVNQTHMKKNNEKVIREKKLYPGYVFINSKMNDKIWYVVRNTPGVRIIVGAETRPIPLSDGEDQDIIRQIDEANERANLVVPFRVDDLVIMKSGDFKGMKGAIREIDLDQGHAIVNIEILGRMTPVMVDFSKIELIN
jgi:transcriptional antiterminator NusG